MKTTLLIVLLGLSTFASAGPLTRSESWIVRAYQNGYSNTYTCQYKTNLSGYGWRTFTANFNYGCPAFVWINGRTSEITVPSDARFIQKL